MEYLIYFLISLAISAVAYMITPKPSAPNPAVQELNLPTAAAGKPKNVVFGEALVKSPNYLWYGKKDQFERKSDESFANRYLTGYDPTYHGKIVDYPSVVDLPDGGVS